MQSIKKAIPSIITLGNLFCGFIGVIAAFNNNLILAFWMILLAGFLDFWDGFAARKLGVAGDFGKELDSLADVVSFGFLPSAILFSMIEQGGVYIEFLKPYKLFLPYLSGIVLLASATRLAKFNIDTEQSVDFRGLATPANAILIGSLAFSFVNKGLYYPVLWFNEALIIFLVISAILLNSRIKLLSLKFKNFAFKENIYRYLLLFISVICLIFYNFESVPVIIIFYILLSILHFRTKNEIQSRN
jgi:CDP-diacylglycerol--serine O-phosphatidyltransferase